MSGKGDEAERRRGFAFVAAAAAAVVQMHSISNVCEGTAISVGEWFECVCVSAGKNLHSNS